MSLENGTKLGPYEILAEKVGDFVVVEDLADQVAPECAGNTRLRSPLHRVNEGYAMTETQRVASN